MDESLQGGAPETRQAGGEGRLYSLDEEEELEEPGSAVAGALHDDATHQPAEDGRDQVLRTQEERREDRLQYEELHTDDRKDVTKLRELIGTV